ncbi:TDP-N-acetylfucosamine:lipid II N-acetylfucosaminyltransferase [Poseidonibacter antarcticus]|uniref:TDP-N-acetylfucosamine:lipid II N-acetylfucosaminyltransferase n=1 Tax=Poseidonibacter antarcticus TaxID=2478538 RepID=UPI000EF520B7|nr:TDP-N-acetylfucosamine:lipid II N-acetylfucosaminyltransferase [Poseidonibacter antarcticus]
MILHIVPDDKFIDMAYNMFEKASPNNNEFMVVTQKDKFKYIKTTPITKITRKEILSKEFSDSLKKYEFIVFHVLSDIDKKLVLNAKENVKFLWLGWGFDYYCYLDKKLLDSRTLKLKESLATSKDFFGKDILRSLKNFIKYNILYKNIDNLEKVFNRINYFAPVLYEDYLLVQNQFKTFHLKYLDWNYGTLEEDFIKEELIISGKNILLGNSASYENNHVEAIELIKNLNLENRQVICPLSYGLEDYAKEVIRHGETVLSNNFEALIDFMKIEEYNKIISTCSIVVMNHLRQQAVGNIVIMMYFGAKVFLNKDNPVYDFFINNGAIVFSMEELTNKNINIDLTEEEKIINKEMLKKYWAKEIILEKTKKLIKIMKEN